MRIEAAAWMEARIATHHGSLTHFVINDHTGGVVIHGLSKTPGLLETSSKPVAPDAAEICNCHQHGFTPPAACG